MKKPAGKAGFTLVELMVVIVILGMISVASIPTFTVAAESSRVDAGAAVLKEIWRAERMYHLEHGSYTDSLEKLMEEFLVDAAALSEEPFKYKIRSTSHGALKIEAIREGGAWSGRLTLNTMGEIGGEVRDQNGHVIKP